MIDKIVNQLKQLDEQQLEKMERILNQIIQLDTLAFDDFSEMLEDDYAVWYSEENKTYRDTMYETIEEIMIENCPWVKDNICESDSFSTIEVGSEDIANIVNSIEMDADLSVEKIELSEVMEWQRVKDIVDTVIKIKKDNV